MRDLFSIQCSNLFVRFARVHMQGQMIAATDVVGGRTLQVYQGSEFINIVYKNEGGSVLKVLTFTTAEVIELDHSVNVKPSTNV